MKRNHRTPKIKPSFFALAITCIVLPQSGQAVQKTICNPVYLLPMCPVQTFPFLEMNPERSSKMEKELLAWEDQVKPHLNYFKK